MFEPVYQLMSHLKRFIGQWNNCANKLRMLWKQLEVIEPSRSWIFIRPRCEQDKFSALKNIQKVSKKFILGSCWLESVPVVIFNHLLKTLQGTFIQLKSLGFNKKKHFLLFSYSVLKIVVVVIWWAQMPSDLEHSNQ